MVGAGYASVVVAKTVGVQKKGSASSVKPLYWRLTGRNQPQSIRVVVVANTGVHQLAFIIRQHNSLTQAISGNLQIK